MKKEQIEIIVNDYFGNADHHFSVNMIGRIAYISIAYRDFKPENTVFSELVTLIPMSRIEIIERSYSDETKLNILQEMMDEDVIVETESNEECYRKVPLAVYIEEKLFDRTINI